MLRAQKASWVAAYGHIIPIRVIRKHIHTGGKRLKQVEDEIRAEKNIRYWVAIVDEKIVGMCTARKKPAPEIRALYVVPSAWGTGAGKKLFDKAMNWLGRKREIILWLEQRNPRATAFYKKNGFRMTKKKSKLDFHGHPMNILMMRKPAGVATSKK